MNLDPYHTQSGWLRVPLAELGLGAGPGDAYQVHDLISDARYLWRGETNFVQIDPFASPAHIFRVRRKVKTERSCPRQVEPWRGIGRRMGDDL